MRNSFLVLSTVGIREVAVVGVTQKYSVGLKLGDWVLLVQYWVFWGLSSETGHLVELGLRFRYQHDCRVVIGVKGPKGFNRGSQMNVSVSRNQE